VIRVSNTDLKSDILFT